MCAAVESQGLVNIDLVRYRTQQIGLGNVATVTIERIAAVNWPSKHGAS